MTFNPDWHPENGWTRKHAPFIIQSAPELSTWINKSGSYLLKQNWISSPTGSGWRKLSAPLFWFVSASYRGRILFFSAIQPPALGSPRTPFPMCCVRPIGPETTCADTTSLFSCFGACSPSIVQPLMNPNLRAGGEKPSRLLVRYIYHHWPTADCLCMCLRLGIFNTWIFLKHLFFQISQFYPHLKVWKSWNVDLKLPDLYKTQTLGAELSWKED